MKLNLSIKGFSMRIFRWYVDFSPTKESAIAPVWIRIEGLPLYMFDEASLLSMANAIGKPLRVHPNNVNRVKLNSANVCKKGQVEALNGYDKIVHPKQLNQASQVFDNFPQPGTSTQTGQIMLFYPQSKLHLAKSDINPWENVVPSKVWQKVKHNRVGVLNGDDNVITLKVQNRFASHMDSEIKEHITGHEKQANIFTEVIAASAQTDSKGCNVMELKEAMCPAGYEQQSLGFVVELKNVQLTSKLEGNGEQPEIQSTQDVNLKRIEGHQKEGPDLQLQVSNLDEREPELEAHERADVAAIEVMRTSEALLGTTSEAIAQVAEDKAEIHGDNNTVGFSTPEKGSNFTIVSTPSSWANRVEEEEQQVKKRGTTIQVPQIGDSPGIVRAALLTLHGEVPNVCSTTHKEHEKVQETKGAEK
ncbi:hypothetical protein LIER_27727 [Lithospermum erythrorhizon]|uniref:DUF4283 domain-containing protein n=1 Tax=Lithospermum erythrorhizon TaxID=34254 RepID=A0AAV3RGQ1_LITER